MERWAKGFEDVIFDIADKIYVGSDFIKQDVLKKRYIAEDKLEVTPFPLDFDEMDSVKAECLELGLMRQDIILFSGRNVDEKQPHLFDQMEKHFVNRDWTFINSMRDLNLSKREYYKLLAQTKVVVSFALQEKYQY